MESLVIYGIGYLAVRRCYVNPAGTIAKITRRLNGMNSGRCFPAMLPPPTPFKMFVLAASAFEMRLTHFLAAVLPAGLCAASYSPC